jgi:hypothetical protein
MAVEWWRDAFNRFAYYRACGELSVSGTKEGGRNAARSNKDRYGMDYYSQIGIKGGSVKGIKKGFATFSKEKISAAGRKGGYVSSRSRATIEEFIKVWDNSDTVNDVARRLGMTQGSVYSKAYLLRKQGYKLKYRIKTDAIR